MAGWAPVEIWHVHVTHEVRQKLGSKHGLDADVVVDAILGDRSARGRWNDNAVHGFVSSCRLTSPDVVAPNASSLPRSDQLDMNAIPLTS